MSACVLIGVISDTHGLMRPQIEDAFADVDHIVHAGDVDDRGILDTLSALAPLTAVRGNCDFGYWASNLPEVQTIEIGGARIRIVHDRDWMPPPRDVDAVIFGHTHVPEIFRTDDGVLWFNPGSAGPPRLQLPVTAGRLHVVDGQLEAELVVFERRGGFDAGVARVVDYSDSASRYMSTSRE